MAGDELKTKTDVKPSSVKVFNCPTCGAGVVLRAAGQSVTAVCGSCAAIIDSSNENYKVISQATQKGSRNQVIPLGKRGKLHGVVWEVIGYVERVDATYVSSWSEYLLYNPLRGFRWLTEFDGHWNYVITTKAKPDHDTGSGITDYGQSLVRYLGKSYHLFHTGQVRVQYVVGEFYWQVKQGETVEVTDYVSPPEVLSCEKNAKEVVWSIGQYLDAAEVKSVFKITDPMPLQSGVAPNQPSTVSDETKSIGKYWGLFIGILIALQFLHLIQSKYEVVYSGQFTFSSADPGKTMVTPQFELRNGLSNLEFILSAPVQNSWFEVQGDLVNDDSGETLTFEKGVEFYTGHDSDGYWSEGSSKSGLILSSIPSGKYHLNLEGMNAKVSDIPFEVTVRRNVATWSNFLWAMTLISILPLLIWWRSRSFELSRWSQSDHSPYSAHQEEDE